MACGIGYRATDVKNRVQELVDKLVAGRGVTVTSEVAAPPGATEGASRKLQRRFRGMRCRMVGRL